MKKIAIYSSHLFERDYLLNANKEKYELVFIDEPLTLNSITRCAGCTGITVFTSDDVSADVLDALKQNGIRFICTRSTGFDHIDLDKAGRLSIPVANVPAYSPNAIAEHAVALMLALNRRLISSSNKVTHFDFRIDELIGFNLHGKVAGIIGTGKIGSEVCKILHGFGCRLIATDINQDEGLVKQYHVKYVPIEKLFAESDIITLHAPLNEQTKYIIKKQSIMLMKRAVMLINTSRGKLVNSIDVLDALNTGAIGYFGTDVYENEKAFFFKDHSEKGIDDSLLKSLINHKNVLLTAHHAFLTKEALTNIADMTIKNIDCFVNNVSNPNMLSN